MAEKAGSRKVYVFGINDETTARLRADVLSTGDINVAGVNQAEVVVLADHPAPITTINLLRRWGFSGEVVVSLAGRNKTERDFDAIRDAGASVVVH